MKRAVWSNLVLLALWNPSLAQAAAIDTTNDTIPFAVQGQTVASIGLNGMAIHGTAPALAPLDVNGEIKIGMTGLACDPAHGGSLRWTGSQMQLCDGTSWVQFGGSPYDGEWYGPDGGPIRNQDIQNGTDYGTCTGPYHPYISWNSSIPVINCHHN